MAPQNLPALRRHKVKVNPSALEIVSYFARNAANSAFFASLSSVLFGIMALLTLAAVVFLLHQRSLSRNQVRVVLPSTIFLFASSAMHMSALVWNAAATHTIVSDAASSDTYDGQESLSAFERSVYAQSWTITLAVAANVTIGDAIVWWRAHAIWESNRIVACGGLLLLTLTFVSGVVGVCTAEKNQSVLEPSLVFAENVFADSSAVLTLATNVIATSLIAYKAWEHKESLKACLGTQRMHSRVLKALALVVESGLIYSTLLAFAVVYQTGSVSFKEHAAPGFIRAEGYFTYGCLSLIMAIHPTTIVVIVALNRSITDSALSQDSSARSRLPEDSVLFRSMGTTTSGSRTMPEA